METHWAIDLGTTNTLIAKWVGTHATTVALEELVDYEPAWHTPLIPSVIYFQDVDRAIIGRPAIAAREFMTTVDLISPGPMARSFKKTLANASQRIVAQVGSDSISARDCATIYMRELLLQTAAYERLRVDPDRTVVQKLLRALRWWRKEGQVIDLTMTVPVESYEPYRAELKQIANKLGVSTFRTLDEPVAAALGYGVDLTDEKRLMIVDFGGGTLDIAIVRTHPVSHSGKEGGIGNLKRATLLAARGLAFGGENIDGWIADMGCERLNAHQETLRPLLLSQSETIKKDLSNKANVFDSSYFLLQGGNRIEIKRNEFLLMLEERGLYKTLETLTQATLYDCQHEINEAEIDAVLLVGGSTLLPGIRELFEQMFGPQRVHYWEPFEAVVKGAAVYGAGFTVDQIIHHDYAIKVYNDEKQRTEYERLVKRGTAYPTPNPFETRYYSVTEGQQIFRLPVCEIGYGGRMALHWIKRGNGNEYWLPTESEETECVVNLNEGDQLKLFPPGASGKARLRIDFYIDANRYLCATIHDLLRQRDIKTEEHVVMLR